METTLRSEKKIITANCFELIELTQNIEYERRFSKQRPKIDVIFGVCHEKIVFFFVKTNVHYKVNSITICWLFRCYSKAMFAHTMWTQDSGPFVCVYTREWGFHDELRLEALFCMQRKRMRVNDLISVKSLKMSFRAPPFFQFFICWCNELRHMYFFFNFFWLVEVHSGSYHFCIPLSVSSQPSQMTA